MLIAGAENGSLPVADETELRARLASGMADMLADAEKRGQAPPARPGRTNPVRCRARRGVTSALLATARRWPRCRPPTI